MIRVVEGKPIRAGERELVPLVRVEARVRRQAFVGNDRLAGQGRGYVCMHPVAILERSAAGERRIPIQDCTAQAVGGLLLAAFVIPLLLALAVNLAKVRNQPKVSLEGGR
jgi:hypothetical protein